MHCERCKGLMLQGDVIDVQESLGMRMQAWRCLNCWHAVDPVMIANRQRHARLETRQKEIIREMIGNTVIPVAAAHVVWR